MRKLLQWAWVHLLYFTGCLWWARFSLSKTGAIVVLTFHRVLEDQTTTNSQDGLIVRGKTFDQLCAYLKSGYQVVSIETSMPGEASKRLKVACTFDDGWEDNYRNALPSIRRHKVPVSIFLCPGHMNQANAFWPERAVAALKTWNESAIDSCIETLKSFTPEQRQRAISALEKGKTPTLMSSDRTMSWQDASEMASAGVRFGSHTMMHEILTNLPLHEARKEMEEAKEAIENRLGTTCSTLAYPNGNFSDEIRSLAAELGYRRALGTNREAWTSAAETFAVPRFNTYEGNLVNPLGSFSPAMFMYTTVWQGWLKLNKAKMSRHFSGTPSIAEKKFSPATGRS